MERLKPNLRSFCPISSGYMPPIFFPVPPPLFVSCVTLESALNSHLSFLTEFKGKKKTPLFSETFISAGLKDQRTKHPS